MWLIEHSLQELVEFKWKNLDGGRQVRISRSSLFHLHYYFLANQGLGNQICKFDEQEVCIANSWFELLSVVRMMALLTLTEANSMLIPEDYSSSCERAVSAGWCSYLSDHFGLNLNRFWKTLLIGTEQLLYGPDNMRNAVDLLLKAAGYLEFSVRDVLVHLPPHIKYVSIYSNKFKLRVPLSFCQHHKLRVAFFKSMYEIRR